MSEQKHAAEVLAGFLSGIRSPRCGEAAAMLRTIPALEAELDALRADLETEVRLNNEGQAREDALRAEVEALRADSERYRWMRDTLHKAVGGGLEINDSRLYYEEPDPGEAVRLFWYPDTPIGFYEFKADTIDAAIDAARNA